MSKRMQEEFVDLDALDTGLTKGLVIQDPEDKQKVKGFVYLAQTEGQEFDPAYAQGDSPTRRSDQPVHADRRQGRRAARPTLPSFTQGAVRLHRGGQGLCSSGA